MRALVNTSISSNIAYWKDEIDTTRFMIMHVKVKLDVIKRSTKIENGAEQRLLSEKRNLEYELKEMKKNLNFWLWVNKSFGEGYEETFSHPMEDDE